MSFSVSDSDINWYVWCLVSVKRDLLSAFVACCTKLNCSGSGEVEGYPCSVLWHWCLGHKWSMMCWMWCCTLLNMSCQIADCYLSDALTAAVSHHHRQHQAPGVSVCHSDSVEMTWVWHKAAVELFELGVCTPRGLFLGVCIDIRRFCMPAFRFSASFYACWKRQRCYKLF